jgi:RNA polymerase sigma factor (sigma-70 family)
MQERDDNALLAEYVEHDSQEAFATLVARHVNKVYSVALRHTRNPHSAEEITQAVFVILAQKSRKLGNKVILSGWLYQTARWTAVTFIRSEIRRSRRGQEAYMQTAPDEKESELWSQIAPELDAAMAGLSETDRHAIVLRFFDGKSMKEVGAALGASEDAVKMRVSRAIEKLQNYFSKRGIHSPVGTIAGAISANSVQVAPAMLAKTATAIALAKGAAASTSTVALMDGATKLMAWANAKVAVTIGVAIVLAAGTATLIAQREQSASALVDLPKSSWKYAGFGSPEATVQTLMWAISQTNGKVLMEALSPDCQEDFRQYVAQNKPGLTVEGFLLQQWTPKQQEFTDLRIKKKEAFAPNEVLVLLKASGGNQAGDLWLKFKKIGDDWKIDDFDPQGPNGRTAMPHPNAQYGGIGIAVEVDPATHAPRITKVLPALAESQTNLVPGLILQKINGTPTAGKRLAECVFLTRGRVGTEVVLELFNPVSGQTNTVETNRKRFTRTDTVILGIR